MTNEESSPSVDPNELLTRFVLTSRHLRQDGTIKPDAFIPYPWPDLSVTRHLQLTEKDLWRIGQNIATQTAKTLHGRADVKASDFQHHQLSVVAAPVDENPNHTNVTKWPEDKPAQKIIAQQIAAAAQARKVPSEFAHG